MPDYQGPMETPQATSEYEIQTLKLRVKELESKQPFVVIELGPQGSKPQGNVYGPFTREDAEKFVKDFRFTRWTSAVFMEYLRLTKPFTTSQ